MCKWPTGTEDASNRKWLIYKKEQRQKERVGMAGEGIGHEGHHKHVIWCDDDEIIILKIESNDKYYTFWQTTRVEAVKLEFRMDRGSICRWMMGTDGRG